MLPLPLYAGLYLQCLHQVQASHAHHPMPTKCQLSAHKYCKVVFGQTTRLTHVDPYSPHLSAEGIKRIQGIIGTFLYYARAVDNKLIATLSTLSSNRPLPPKPHILP
jgi:hypothetical protein